MLPSQLKLWPRATSGPSLCHHLSPGTPGTASSPALGAAGRGGGEASFPHVPAERGDTGGTGVLLAPWPPRPPLRSELDSRHRYRLRWPRRGGAAPHPRTRHTPHAQTDSDTDGTRGEPCAPPGRVKASRSGRGLGGVFGYHALKAAVLQASEEARCPRGPPTPALPRTAERGRRQLSFPGPPDPLPSPKPISSQHPRREHAVWVSALQ